MTILADLRKKYPEYNDMSDEELANSYHKKYYSDLSKDDFYSKIGFNKNHPINPREFLQQGFENYKNSATRLGKDVAVGLTESGRQLANTPHKLANFFGQGDLIPNFAPPDFDYAKAYGLEGPLTLSDKLVQGLAQYAPEMALPGANIGKAGELISRAPKVGQFLKGAVEQSIPQAAYGATQNEDLAKGAMEGGLGSLVGSAIGRGIESGINVLRPSQIYKTPLNKRELASAYRQAEGTNTDLGNIIENPKLQRWYENKLPKLTGDTSDMMQKTGGQIVEKGENILKRLLGNNSSENVPVQLTKQLTDAYRAHRKLKTNIYDAVDKVADKEGLKLDLASFAKEATKYKEAIEATTILQHEPDSKKILSKLVNYENPVRETTKTGLLVDKNGKPLLEETKKTYPTLKEANILKGTFSRYAKMYAKSSDASQRNMAEKFKNLSKKLKSDINRSIENSGSEVLKKGYKEAEENYAKNYSPFLDKDIYKFISGNADPETLISKFITRSNTSDLGQKLSKLSEKLSKPGGTEGSQGSNLLAYGYLSRALDNKGIFSPKEFSTLIKQLGPNQLKALFPDKAMRREVLNYKSLIDKNTRSLYVMYNPMNGQLNSDMHAHVLANLVGGLTGALTGGAPGAVLGSIAGPLLNSKVAQFATKKLSDPVYRRKFINALIANKEFQLPTTRKALQKGGALIGDISGNDKYQRPLELEVIGKRNKEK